MQDWGAAAPARAPGVLLVHGYAQSHRCWLHQLASPLAREFHLVSYDLRGHGDSDKPLQPEYYREAKRWADELRAVIEACGLERPVVMVWSYSGRVILDFLSVYGEQALSGVIMVSATSSLAAQLRGPASPLLEQMSDTDPLRRLEATREMLMASVARPLPPEEFDYMLAYNERVPAAVRANLRGRPAPYESVLHGLTLPTLLVHGELDPINLPAMSAYTASCVRNARLLLYPGCAHMPFWEAPQRFNADVSAFLRGIGG